MTDRNRLIEILSNVKLPINRRNSFGSYDTIGETRLGNNDIERIVDSLLANGVIVSPCKVGDTVWFNTFKKNATVCVGIQPHIVDRIDVNCVCDTKNLIETSIPCWTFGKTVFLTKEEAEAKLKEREGK